MGIRFSKSIKIGNYLKLNFSKSGVSATIGKKGASVNVGGKGAYLNLSPSAVGIKGTGLSYRQRILGGFNSDKKTKKKDSDTNLVTTSSLKKKGTDVTTQSLPDTSVIDDYNHNYEASVNLHKYTDNVLSKQSFKKYVDKMEDGLSKQLYLLSIEGDEDTIENLVSSFMNNLSLAYDVRVNYELEDNILYVDLDLPEIEDLSRDYPVLVKDEVVYKKKTNTMLKEEYARLVMSISVFLSANYFNLSSYIDEIVISGFTTVRNNVGDLVDQYLYSVKYDRAVFEKTDLSKVDDLNDFILQFENRINLSATNSFKAIKPFETELKIKTDSLIDEAVLGLKELGYKKEDINKVLSKLSEYQFETSGEYLKEALRLMRE